ncbi:MAG: hypothetical protein GXO74_12840 [Calditrichaeota bacterium]|nr:hypothetical protein [Calditrichota bacterium]
MKESISRQLKENFNQFCQGLFKAQATGIMAQEAADLQDMFFVLCFGDLLGIPTPTSYYTLELLPYLASELETWEQRMGRRYEVVFERFGRYDFCC